MISVTVIVGFSSGENWRVSGSGWAEFSELTREVLAERGLGNLAAEICSYGMSFDQLLDEVRLPLAGAMLIASRRWHAADLAEGNDGDHLRQLVDLLEIEVVTAGRPPAVCRFSRRGTLAGQRCGMGPARGQDQGDPGGTRSG
jgi:hypothetical protein